MHLEQNLKSLSPPTQNQYDMTQFHLSSLRPTTLSLAHYTPAFLPPTHKASLPQGSVFAINLCRGNSAPRSVCLAPSHCSSSSIFTEAPLVCTVSPCFHFFIALITLKTQKNLSCSFPCSSLAFFHLSALSGPETLYIFFITIFRA